MWLTTKLKMENTQDFLNGLNKLTFVGCEGKTFFTKEGFEVSFEFKMSEALRQNYPIQIVFYIKKEDVYVSHWGCFSNECNVSAVEWINTTKWRIKDAKYKADDTKKEEYKNLFNQLTK